MKAKSVILVMILGIAILISFPKHSSAIINGSPTSDFTYVGMVQGDTSQATGTIIADGWVLTSAVVAQSVQAGGMWSFVTDGGSYPVIASYPNPNFSYDEPNIYIYNVGLLQVEGLKQDSYPALMVGNDVQAGQSVTLVGYGGVDAYGTGKGVRRSGTSSPISDIGPGYFNTYVDETHAHAGPGDNGGPALYSTANGFLLAGVIGVGDQEYNTFTAYSSIAYSKAWVDSCIRKHTPIALNTNSFNITKNKKSGSTTTSMSGTIPNLPALNLANGDTVNAIITIQLLNAVSPGVDLVITSDKMTLNVTDSSKAFTIRK